MPTCQCLRLRHSFRRFFQKILHPGAFWRAPPQPKPPDSTSRSATPKGNSLPWIGTSICDSRSSYGVCTCNTSAAPGLERTEAHPAIQGIGSVSPNGNRQQSERRVCGTVKHVGERPRRPGPFGRRRPLPEACPRDGARPARNGVSRRQGSGTSAGRSQTQFQVAVRGVHRGGGSTASRSWPVAPFCGEGSGELMDLYRADSCPFDGQKGTELEVHVKVPGGSRYFASVALSDPRCSTDEWRFTSPLMDLMNPSGTNEATASSLHLVSDTSGIARLVRGSRLCCGHPDTSVEELLE